MGNNKIAHAYQINRRDFLRRSTLAGLTVAGAVPNLSWAVRGEELHIRNYTDLTTLDPPFQISGGESMVADAIFQTLVKLKTNGTWDTELDAAEYFEAIDNTHYAFRLKRNQVFSDGFGEMTADDVKFSFERIIDPKISPINAPDMGTLSHVDVHDRYSGTIVLWDALKALEKSGVSEVDFEGVNSPARGWFKLSFGGDLRPYYEVKWG